MHSNIVNQKKVFALIRVYLKFWKVAPISLEIPFRERDNPKI